ncbi:Protein WVD2-like 1 [Hibiscus syriacus]|uniref:Protein WVD2-like 1 n=1 Tax=Hibiscus syriacus TaxID=106335 RepID=A0A6A2YXQ3_HIBSY|nr:Protein WVD2-like 1 [Hibiscus syriacus]
MEMKTEKTAPVNNQQLIHKGKKFKNTAFKDKSLIKGESSVIKTKIGHPQRNCKERRRGGRGTGFQELVRSSYKENLQVNTHIKILIVSSSFDFCFFCPCIFYISNVDLFCLIDFPLIQAHLGPSKAGANDTTNADYTPSPTKDYEKNSPKTPLMTRKHHDDDDNWSVASSTTTSVRTGRSRVTIGTAPTFRSAERAEKRKDFYQKLEGKHQALEAERQQYAALKLEEQEAALKQLRKSLVVKANPVPSFDYEQPPPKVELKKLPLTRPKSPNLSPRKSCGDAGHLFEEELEKPKACCQGHRHSFGGNHMERIDPADELKFKGQKNGVGSNGGGKLKDRVKKVKDTTKSSKLAEESNANIAVQS